MNRKKSMRLLAVVLFAAVVFIPVSCRRVDTLPRIDFTIDLTNGNVTDVSGQYQTTIGDFYKLALTGGYVYVNGLIIFKGIDLNYYALSQYCSFDACNIDYDVAYNELVCPCDQSHFDIYGTATFGPAQTPLYKYATSYVGTLLRVYTP